MAERTYELHNAEVDREGVKMAERDEILKELEHEIQYMALSTQRQYRAEVGNYLDFVARRYEFITDAWKERDVLYSYIDYLKKKRHLSQSTINFILRGAIGALFRMQQPALRLPVKLPKADYGGVIDIESRVHFTESEIKKLILVARASGNKQWKNLMALSSIYMLRAGEITQLRKEDIHPLKRTILIRTLKGGLLREHAVPKVVEPYILKYDYPSLPGKKIHRVFHDIVEAAQIELTEQKNIHAVRHGVFTILKNLEDVNGYRVFTEDEVLQFGRWKVGGTITRTYNHPENLKNDQKIFTHHPMLKCWK